MLVLTRRIRQKIIIGDWQIEIEVLGYNRGVVKLGITADKSVPVHREEVLKRIEAERYHSVSARRTP